MAKEANELYVTLPSGNFTPICGTLFLHLFTPDRYKNPDGTLAPEKYCVTLVLDPKRPDHKKFMNELSALNKTVGEEILSAMTKGKSAYKVKDMFKPEEDADGNPTGKYHLKVTSNKKPLVFDSDDKVIPDSLGTTVYGGSTARVRLSLKKSTITMNKTTGLVAYFDRAQIVTLAERPADTGVATGGGFGAVEGGFVAKSDSFSSSSDDNSGDY